MFSLTFSVFSVDILNDRIRIFTDNAALLIYTDFVDKITVRNKTLMK